MPIMKLNAEKSPEPPLSGFWVSILSLVVRFLIVLVRRLIGYFVFFAEFIMDRIEVVAGSIQRSKQFAIRMLMYRGGVFYQSPRLGLTAIMSTTAVAVFIVPVFQPLTEPYSVSTLLQSATNVAQPDSFSMNVLAATPALNTTSSGQSIRTDVIVHTVQPGDTLSTIAELYLVSTEGVKYVNKMSSDLLHPGDELKIPPVDGLFHVVEDGDTLASIADMYSVPEQVIADFNHLEEPFVLHGGQEMIIPNASIPEPKPVVYAAVPKQQVSVDGGLVLQSTNVPSLGTDGFIMPVNAVLTQGFWWGHTAIDLATSCGTPIVAADSGTITFAGWWAGGGGNSIFIDHGNGYVTKYAHMSAFERTGGTVNRGDIIGYIGSTGRSTGCHVHFMIIQNGVPINPMSVL